MGLGINNVNQWINDKKGIKNDADFHIRIDTTKGCRVHVGDEVVTIINQEEVVGKKAMKERQSSQI